MNTVEMIEPAHAPISDREGHIPFEPFTRAEWIWTILLVIVCFGVPMGIVAQYHLEQARLDAAAQVEARHE